MLTKKDSEIEWNTLGYPSCADCNTSVIRWTQNYDDLVNITSDPALISLHSLGLPRCYPSRVHALSRRRKEMLGRKEGNDEEGSGEWQAGDSCWDWGTGSKLEIFIEEAVTATPVEDTQNENTNLKSLFFTRLTRRNTVGKEEAENTLIWKFLLKENNKALSKSSFNNLFPKKITH